MGFPLKFLDLVNRQNSSLIYFHIHIRVKLTLSQVSSSLVSRLCCSRINQTKGLHPSSISKILASDHPKIIAKLSQLTVKLLQGPDQVLGTCSESIGEQNLTRPLMLILRQTLSLVTRNGFPPIGYWRSVSLWIYLSTLTKAPPPPQRWPETTVFTFNRLGVNSFQKGNYDSFPKSHYL